MSGLSFIEQQFPVARVSAESHKERMAGAGSSQTLTGVGKWWGRKPLPQASMPIRQDGKLTKNALIWLRFNCFLSTTLPRSSTP